MALVILIGVTVPTQGASQEAGGAERFAAASIKPAASRSGQGTPGPDHFYRVTTLTSLIAEAYDVPAFLISGLPDWASTERWEVSAKSDARRSSAEMRPLVRALLEDRFALQLHTEKEEFPIYELVLTRADGQVLPGLRLAAGDCDPFTNGQRPFSEAPRDRSGLPGCLQGTLGVQDRVAVRLYNYSIQRFGNALRPFVQRAVVDKTGLPGLYDVVFDFRGGGAALDAGDVPGLETALRESLGLELRSSRGMVDVLMIDSVQLPTPN